MVTRRTRRRQRISYLFSDEESYSIILFIHARTVKPGGKEVALKRVLVYNGEKRKIPGIPGRKDEPPVKNDINEAVKEFQATPGALLIDLRDPEDFQEGHIPGAQCLTLDGIRQQVDDLDAPLFLYCYRGIRSMQAALLLGLKGYTRARSIGGIEQYRGELE